MTIKINRKTYNFRSGQSILEIARQNGIKIPALCYHPDLSVKANCRVCLVEIKGRSRLATACSTLAAQGMEVLTESPRVKRARAVNLELIYAEHVEKCADCSSRYACDLLKFAGEYKIPLRRFPDRKGGRVTYLFANAVEIDGTQCIDCRNCVEACEKQGIAYLEIKGHGQSQEIVPTSKEKVACIYCGQCALHCPVAAAQEQYQWPEVERVLQDKSKIVVAQFAPSIRVSVGEEFGLPYGKDYSGQIIAALRQLGFKHVFDVNFGADITTLTEAEELVERLKDKKAVWPMMTSCCPSWVAYVESRHPELIPNLTSARSPHIHGGGAIKSYWAQHAGLPPKDIVVVSIMPCTAKKYEASRPELSSGKIAPVDYVLTTREFAFLLKKHNINFKNLKPGILDSPFNGGSGAAVIYGSSGGVMESALRSANALICEESKQKACVRRLEFKEVRGADGFREASYDLGGQKIKVGVVSGSGNLKTVLPKLKKYHYIEVMACPGGCIGGGGQPLPTSLEIVSLRAKGLYQIDATQNLRKAHENIPAVEYFNWAKSRGRARELLHTGFSAKPESVLKARKPKKEKIFNSQIF